MRSLILTVVIVLVLLLGADRVALLAAERGVAVAVQQSQNLDQRPTVSIHGFPLLTQALRGRYEQVDGTATNLKGADGLTINRFAMRLNGVRLPLRHLVGNQVSELPVESASAVGLVSYQSLNAAAAGRSGIPGLTLAFSRGSQGRIAVKGRYSGIVDATLTGQADVAVKDGQLLVRPEASTLRGVPSVLSGPLLDFLANRYELPPLPLGFQADRLTVGAAGVTVRASARDVVLTAAQ